LGCLLQIDIAQDTFGSFSQTIMSVNFHKTIDRNELATENFTSRSPDPLKL